MVVALIGTIIWIEAPAIWPKPGPPVELLGINRTITYNGSYSNYLEGTTTSGCPVCPLQIGAGATVTVNVSWISSDPNAFHLNYTFVNVTFRSPYPFLALEWGAGPRPTSFSESLMWEAGGPGGWQGDPLPIDIPFDSGGLPSSGYIQEWINASASTAPWPSPA